MPIWIINNIIISTSFLSWMPIWIINNIIMLYYDRIKVSKKLMLIREANQNSVIFVAIGIFLKMDLSFNHMYGNVLIY